MAALRSNKGWVQAAYQPSQVPSEEHRACSRAGRREAFSGTCRMTAIMARAGQRELAALHQTGGTS